MHDLFVPGTAIFVTVMAFNFLGDGLRDALDPRRVSGGRA
jgi:peptide/nickel transport system permease protein